MLSSRTKWLSALAVALAALALTGTAPAAPAPGGTARVDADRLMPADAVAVGVIDVRRILESPLVKQAGLKDVKDAIKKNKELDQLLTATGIDPLKDIDSAMIAVSGTGADAKLLGTVSGRFNLEKIHATAAALAEKKPEDLAVTKEGGRTLYVFKHAFKGKGQNEALYAAFANAKLLVATNSKEYTLKTVQNAGKRPAPVSKELQAALSKLTGKESAWGAVVITDEIKKGLKAPPVGEIADKLEWLTGSVTLTDALRILVLIQTADADTAGQVKEQINAGLNFAKTFAGMDPKTGPIITELLDNLKLSTTKGTVNIDLKLDKETMEKLEKLGKEAKKDTDK